MSDAPTQKGHGCAKSTGHAGSESRRLVLPFKLPESCHRGASTRLLPGLGVTRRPSGLTDPALLTRRAQPPPHLPGLPSPTQQTRGPSRTTEGAEHLSRVREPGLTHGLACDRNSPTRRPGSRRSVRDGCGLHGHGGPTLTLRHLRDQREASPTPPG